MTMNAPILALDTSTEACSVAVSVDAREAARFAVMPRRHAGELLGMVDAVLEELGLLPEHLHAVAWCHGPGAFTGVRIAAGAVQGIAWGLDCPVIGCSTLAVLAQGAHRRTGAQQVLAALDARMGEVYWGGYRLDPESGLMRPVADDQVAAPGDVEVPGDWHNWLASGSGWKAYGEALAGGCGVPGDCEADALPDARDLLPFAREALATGHTGRSRDAAPVYLRDRVTG